MEVLPGHVSALLTVDSERCVAAWYPSDEQLTPLWQLPEGTQFWNLATAGGNPRALLVARTDGHVAFFDAQTGRALAEPVNTHAGGERYWVHTGSAPGAGLIRFFTYYPSRYESAVSEWTVSLNQLVTSRTLSPATTPDGKPIELSALTSAVLDGASVVIGVGGYSGIYVWNALDGALRDSTWLEQGHGMQLLDVEVANIAGRPIVLCGGFTGTLGMWGLDTHDEHHLRVGSLLYRVRLLPRDRVVVAGTRGAMLIQLGRHLPGHPAPRRQA